MSRAIEPRYGNEATTLTLAWAENGIKRAKRIRFIVSLELARAVRAEDEFELQPDRVVLTHAGPVIEVVFQTNLRELRRIERQVRREPPTVDEMAGIVFAAQAGHPAVVETPEQLSVRAPVVKRLLRQDCHAIVSGDALGGLQPAIEDFGLQRHERPALMRVERSPFPVKVTAGN